jgi:hypothetical protein
MIMNMPLLMIAISTMGTIQWISEVAVQAKRNSPIGSKNDAKRTGMRRRSGGPMFQVRTAGSHVTRIQIRYITSPTVIPTAKDR